MIRVQLDGEKLDHVAESVTANSLCGRRPWPSTWVLVDVGNRRILCMGCGQKLKGRK